MKKFHKRAAVFLTAATLAGLPAGAFFYSSPGSLTVWADNVEVESSEESSPEDVDFSDGSEVEIHADPVEQAQEDAGNDVTETLQLEEMDTSIFPVMSDHPPFSESLASTFAIEKAPVFFVSST